MPTAQCTSIRYTDRLVTVGLAASIGTNVVTYDTGALIAADHNDRHIWALDAGFLAEEISPTVPAPVLAEAWRGGGRQANSAT